MELNAEIADMNPPSPRLYSTASFKESSESRGANGATLSDLPNEVLVIILGFLPIDEAVRTCVLATRWEHLWRSMPHLSFQRNHKKVPRDFFINLVDRVCTLHDPSYPIQRFRLLCDLHDHDTHRINGSITAAIANGQLEDLLMYLPNYCKDELYVPPCSIFSLETLVQLIRLEIFCATKGRLELPDCISLPRLKVLNIGGLRILNVNSTQKLLSSCPLLEELGIRNCCSLYVNSAFTISAPNPRKLSILDELPPLWVHCENLKEFAYYGNLVHEFHLTSWSMKLDQATLGLEQWAFAFHGVKLLNYLSGTKMLTLGVDTFKAVYS